jgi:hypothetical protein
VEKNEVLPENLKTDVRYRDQMYSPKYHGRHTVSSSNIRSDKEL